MHFDDLTGRDGRRLPAPVDGDRHGAGVPVSGLRNRAGRRSGDVIVSLGLVARGSAGGDHKSGVKALPSHTVWIVISPCWPAAGPAIVFVTSSEPAK